jgi:hypothetical protein
MDESWFLRQNDQFFQRAGRSVMPNDLAFFND